ncbi:hypothetical protein BCR44DRAFT_1101378 [Catenaria anguillulae PL171]|uniref:Uncharacterized protein n=1 Tax=Catenaria anguillulae PL171 TaxID=765915 RepID=A0A1Y2I3Q8_9FUNG|nr:hypothetical protein BCR44DRAFT_1101378 [Catenaria anguillulae PL171]
MTMTMTLTKIVLIILNAVLPHNFGDVQIVQVITMIALLGLVNWRNWTHVQWWTTFKGIGISCALISAIVGLVGEAIGVSDAIGFLAALMVSWLAVIVAGASMIRRRHKSIMIPRAREQRRLQSRFAKLMAFNGSSDGSSSYASSDDSSLGSDNSSMHSIAGLSKPAMQLLVGWLLTLEKKQVLSASETSWLIGDAEKRRHGFVSMVFSAVGGEAAGSVEKLQRLLMEAPAIEAVRAMVKQAAEAASQASETSSSALAAQSSTVRFSAALSGGSGDNSPSSHS